MKNLIRSSMKMSFAVALPLVLFLGVRCLPEAEHLLVGLNAWSIDCFGTPAQLRALVDEIARESATREGTLETYLAGEKVAVANALREAHESDAQDPRTIDKLFDISGKQFEFGSEIDTGPAPQCQACKCGQGRVK